jgi:arginyl-tRNA--protein-N-Asp/Glu arginylyltransferase
LKYQENNDIEIGNWKLADVRNLEYILPFQLDQYLQMGWFRMGQTMFTTNFLIFNNEQFNALWLRIDLEKFELTPSQKKLLKQNSRFDLKVTSGQIDYQKEDLYYKYRESLSFSIAPSLQNLLTGNSLFDIFDSRHIEIYDNGSLIACGVFDVGNISAQGIVSVFDPAYRKFSLGKYLFLQKILFLKANGYKYFYPGYYVPGYGQFDYKLDMAKESTTFFDFGKKNWLPMNILADKHQPLRYIQAKLQSLSHLLLLNGFKNQLLQYNFFDICLVNSYADYGLLDVPLFLYCFPNSRQQEAIIVFNIFTDQFQFAICNKPFQSNIEEISGHYVKFLLKLDTIIFQHNDETLFVERLIEIVKS